MNLTPLHKVVIAFDVHQAKINGCALIENPLGQIEEVLVESDTFLADLDKLASWCASLNPDLVVMESTGIYWKSFYESLEQFGIRADVVNSRHVKNVPGRKTDIADAKWLATLARAGLLNGSFVPPQYLRQCRLISHQRSKLVGQLASEKNRLHKILTDAGIRLSVVVSDLNGQSARLMIQALIEGQLPHEVIKLASKRLKAPRKEILDALHGRLSDNHRFLLEQILEHIQWIEKAIVRLDKRLSNELLDDLPEIKLLQTVPGIDHCAAGGLIAEIGSDMSVFGSSERLASWAGMCPGNRESAGKRKSGATRQGNRHVRRILCEAAHAAARTQCALKAKFDALRVRCGYKRAIIAIGHKLLRIIYAMLSNAQPYRDSTVDYQALSVKRNAPRWIKMLIKYDYIQPQQA